ncbi:MAG: hydrogenase nickel incorporation protein HypB [Magnetococcales bacterium]|nr:hydrogenase nickel incorporation protein HypB [Magnetococcales bacterium]
MCTTCGCGGEAHLEDPHPEGRDRHGHGHDHAHDHAHGVRHVHLHLHDPDQPHDHPHAHDHLHDHDSPHDHDHPQDHDHSHDHAHPHDHDAPPTGERRTIDVEEAILSRNQGYADENRRWLESRGILALNLISAPGSGKTAVLEKTLQALAGRFVVSVIEGDQRTSLDAERIRDAGGVAVQINTGKGCHLDAHMVGHALQRLDPPEGSLLFIENVGNLVCPAGFDLGEEAKAVLLSVTEGEDKPLKYPEIFKASRLMLLNKSDLLPYLDFDPRLCQSFALRVNPALETRIVSARTGEGIDTWVEWIEEARGRFLQRLGRGG